MQRPQAGLDGVRVPSPRSVEQHGQRRPESCRPERQSADEGVGVLAGLVLRRERGDIGRPRPRDHVAQRTGLGVPRRVAPGHAEAKRRQHQERPRHHERRLAAADVRVAWRAGERQEPQPKHVEGRQPGRQQRHREQHEMGRVRSAEPVGRGQHLILARPAAEERRPDDRQHPDEHGVRRQRHCAAKAAHLPQVLLVMAAEDHAAGREEQERLEERMSQQVQQPRRPAADAEGQHHVAELTDRRIRQDSLDVGLHDGDGRGQDERDGPGVGDDEQHFGREQRKRPTDEVDAGRHHRGRVDEGAHRRRPLHRVGQPSVERELRRLADAAEEDAGPHDAEQPIRHGSRRPAPADAVRGPHPAVGRDSSIIAPEQDHMRSVPGDDDAGGVDPVGPYEARRRVIAGGRPQFGEHLLEVERAEIAPGDGEADEEAGVADAVDDERLVGGRRGGGALVVEADQQERTDADQFPADEHHEQVVGDQDGQHREAE